MNVFKRFKTSASKRKIYVEVSIKDNSIRQKRLNPCKKLFKALKVDFPIKNLAALITSLNNIRTWIMQ